MHRRPVIVAQLTPVALLVILAVAVLLGDQDHGDRRRSAPLVVGGRPAALSAKQLHRARRVARAFARSFAAGIFSRSAPLLAGASPGVLDQVRSARARTPLTDQGARARLGPLDLAPTSDGRVDARMWIKSARRAPFPITFSLARRRDRWLVVELGDD